ncbi:hypothetical protein PFAG_05976, partial [Plasmodium falciparum Santa Lucia]
MGKGCTDCFFACHSYENWIDNQRKQFDKQKKKYTKEISDGGGRKKRAVGGTTKYEGYEKSFYEKLKNDGYGTVDAFLGLLNNEKACKDITDGGKINFKEVNSGGGVVGGGSGGTSGASGTNDENKGTFYRSEYCQPCPDCGVQHKGGNQWEEKDKSKEKCDGQKLYKPINGKNGTPIKILKSGEGHDDIEKKLKEFCLTQNSSDGSVGSVVTTGVSGGNSEKKELYDEWKCYKHNEVQKVNVQGEVEEDDDELKGAGGLCILPNPKKNKEVSEAKSQNNHADIQKTFHDFFYYWVAHMLKDSIHWRTKRLKSCISDGKTMKCRNGCNKKCDCFEKWVKQKETEWKPIKDHFKTQEGIPEGYYFTTLELILKLQFLKEDTEENTENSLDAEEAEELKHLQKILKLENENNLAVVNAGTEQKTLMDKLIDYEERIATECKETHKSDPCTPQQPPPESPGGDGGPGRRNPSENEDEEDEEEEEEEEEENVEEEKAEVDSHQQEALPDETEVVEETVAEVTEVTEVTGVKPCEIVQTLFTSGDNNALKEACRQKYGPGGKEKFPNWKCVTPSGEKSGSGNDGATGGLCIPPRRRRLYVGKLEQWATTAVSPQVGSEAAQGTTPATASRAQSHPLLAAFVESAAIETFFAWHRYKKIKEKEIEEKRKRENGELVQRETSDDPEHPQNKLKSGTIPPDFLRLMFYTLGDYRDICIGVKEDVIKALKASGDKNIDTINEKIEKILNSDDESSRGPKKNPSDEKRKTWWNNNAKHIWHGMICALTYNTDTQSGTAPQQDTKVKEALFGKDEKPNNTPKTQYQYNSVTLKEEASGAKTDPLNNPKLKDFVEIPTYFRYLHEWGQNFCKERKKRLKQVETDCMRNGKKQYSGYGEDCDDQLPDDPTNFKDLGSSCPKSCSSYRKWIDIKKTQYEKQKEIYNEQKQNCKEESNGAAPNNGGNTFCGTVQRWPNAAAFLQNLGPCKVQNGKGKQIFQDERETFQHAKDCNPCSEFKVKCEGNGHCDNSNGNNCKDNKITANDIENGGNSTVLEMRVSADSKSGFNDDGLDKCANADIFEGIRKDEWTCDTVCGYVVCKPKTSNGNKNDEGIIIINALLRRWLEYFLHDYNKIKQKISHCTKNGEGFTCINGCVDQWINQKRTEWENIKKRFNEQYKDQTAYNVKSVLETLQPQTDVNKAIKPCDSLTKFESFCGLNGTENSPNGKEGTPKDIVECLLNKLTEKITSCQKLPIGSPQANCVQSSPLPDEEPEDLTLEEENTVEKPAICGDIEEQKEKEESGCVPAKTKPEKPAPPAPSKEPGSTPSAGEKPAQDTKDNPPKDKVPAPAPLPPPPLPSDNTSDILKTTIPFGIALALTSIALLFLK